MDMNSDQSIRNIKTVAVDPYRRVVFPNRLRELRLRAGFGKLLGLSEAVPTIPYIRISKIERGEVVARANELRELAQVLGVSPEELLLDIDAPDFSMAEWAEPLKLPEVGDNMRYALLLAAAVRAQRTADGDLSQNDIRGQFDLPPVMLSRIENAAKPIDRWNAETLSALSRLLGVESPDNIQDVIERRFHNGDLDEAMQTIPGREARLEKTRAKIAELRSELAGKAPTTKPIKTAAAHDQGETVVEAAGAQEAMVGRELRVIGEPLLDGLIALTSTDRMVPAPLGSGPRTYCLKTFRATLGPGMPAGSLLFVDPDQAPNAGGLAVVTEDNKVRLLAVSIDRIGAMIGHSLHPDLQIPLDDLRSCEVARVIGAIFPDGSA